MGVVKVWRRWSLVMERPEGEDDGIVMEELVEEWSNRLGPKYQVKVCTHVPAFCSGIPSNANTLKMSLLQGCPY